MQLSRAFLRDAARAKYAHNQEQLEAVGTKHDVELTPEVIGKINQKIKDSKRNHTVEYQRNRSQRAETQGDAVKYFLFAAAALVLLIGGLTAGRFFYSAAIVFIVFLMKGIYSGLDSPSAKPFEFTEHEIS